MILLFILIMIGGGAFFLKRKSGFDYYSLAFFSCVIYFMPGFFGKTAYNISSIWYESPIASETYAIMIAVPFSIVLSAMLGDRIAIRPGSKTVLTENELFLKVVMLLCATGFVMLLLTSGSALFDPSKAEVLESLNRWNILFYISAVICFPVAVLFKRKIFALIVLAMLLFHLYIGFRSALAIAVLSTITVLLHDEGRSLLRKIKIKTVLPIAAAGLIFFGYKQIGFVVKAGMWDVVWTRLQDAQFYMMIFEHAEPFTIQHILNTVVIQDFHTNFDSIYSAAYQFILFAPGLGAEPVSFNSIMQPALFPGVWYGMASNIWAQMWSIGGWPLLLFFILLFNFVLFLGNLTLRSKNIVIKGGLAPIFCYWAFYIHRNDLLYIFNLEKRVLLVFLISVVIVRLFRSKKIA